VWGKGKPLTVGLFKGGILLNRHRRREKRDKIVKMDKGGVRKKGRKHVQVQKKKIESTSGVQNLRGKDSGKSKQGTRLQRSELK